MALFLTLYKYVGSLHNWRLYPTYSPPSFKRLMKGTTVNRFINNNKEYLFRFVEIVNFLTSSKSKTFAHANAGEKFRWVVNCEK